MAKKQFYGIKYPFMSQDDEKYFLDLNKDVKTKIKSLLMHVVFTPKGQKIRDPEFGTNLIKYLYDPNDTQTWDSVVYDIKDTISRFVNGITIDNVQVLPPDDERRDVYVRLDYTINNGFDIETDSLITKI